MFYVVSIVFMTIKEPESSTTPSVQASNSNPYLSRLQFFYGIFISTRLIMDAKLMLVLIFTTTVVVTGYPSTNNIAHPLPPSAQVTTCGNNYHVTLGSGEKFVVKLCNSSKDYEYKGNMHIYAYV